MDLVVGANTITITVTATGVDDTVYTVEVTRTADARSDSYPAPGGPFLFWGNQ